MKNLTIDENLILDKSSFILQDSLILVLNVEKIKNCLSAKPSYIDIEDDELLQNIDISDELLQDLDINDNI